MGIRRLVEPAWPGQSRQDVCPHARAACCTRRGAASYGPLAAAVRQLEAAAGVGLQVAIVRVASQASGYRFRDSRGVTANIMPLKFESVVWPNDGRRFQNHRQREFETKHFQNTIGDSFAYSQLTNNCTTILLFDHDASTDRDDIIFFGT